MAKALPARFLHGAVNIDYVTDFQMDPASPVIGAAYKWAASIFVNPQIIGLPLDTFSYSFDGTHVQVGDWVASSENGRALRIAEILSADISSLSVILEDVDSYNALIDTTFAQDGSIPSNTCILFTLSENGFPILGPLNPATFPEVAQANLLARFDYIADYTFPGGGGGSDFLGEPTDGSYSEGAVKGWTVGVTKKDDALDQLNQMLVKALPEQPTAISDANMGMAGDVRSTDITDNLLIEGNGHTGFKLADGVIPNNTGKTIPAHSEIIALRNTNASSTLTSVGLGNIGTLTFKINGTVSGTVDLTPADDTGTYGDMNIISDVAFPQGTTGIWQALTVNMAKAVTDGINEFHIEHSWTGSKSVTFVNEPAIAAPVISDTSATPAVTNVEYISGVPHLKEGSSFTYGLTAANCVGRTYSDNFILGFGTSIDFSAKLGSAEFPALTLNNGPITATAKQYVLDYTTEAFSGELVFFATNALTRTALGSGTKINFAGTGHSKLRENPGTSAQTAKRVALGSGDRPTVTAIDWDTDFDSGSAGDLGDLELWDAPIVGGTARVDQTNYSVGYHPAGPDFSGKPTTQYVSFKLQSISNRIKLAVIGSYTGLFIKLPGITNDMPNAVNGWWDATKQADHAPLNWPGHANASDGCLINAVNGEIDLTFGNISSASSTENMILVRFVLTGDDEISGIRLI